MDGAYLSYEEGTIQGALVGYRFGTEWGKGCFDAFRRDRFPVAGYFAMKRGVEIEAVHFASPPYTSERRHYKSQRSDKETNPLMLAVFSLLKSHSLKFKEIQEACASKAIG